MNEGFIYLFIFIANVKLKSKPSRSFEQAKVTSILLTVAERKLAQPRKKVGHAI